MLRERTAGFAKEQFIVAADDVVRQRTNVRVAESLVQRAGAVVERGDADEHVGRNAEDPLFGKGNELAADSFAAYAWIDDHTLEISDKRTGHAENDESSERSIALCDVNLARRIAQN